MSNEGKSFIALTPGPSEVNRTVVCKPEANLIKLFLFESDTMIMTIPIKNLFLMTLLITLINVTLHISFLFTVVSKAIYK